MCVSRWNRRRGLSGHRNVPAGVRGSHEHCSAGLVALVEQLTCIDLVRDARLDVGGDIPINVFKRDGIDAD